MNTEVRALTDADKAVSSARWSEHLPSSDAFSPAVYWLANPAVQRRHQRRACAGKPYGAWYEYCFKEFLAGHRADRFLSIGCGAGALERDLHRIGSFRDCDGIDLSPVAIEAAKREAGSLGMTNIHYSAVDVERADIGRGRYDAVWFSGSLHHIERLAEVCAKVGAALRPDGWLFIDEYVGPNHFAFDERQREIIQAAFMLIPPEYRRSFVPESFGMVQQRVGLPNPIEVARVDPSEAVRSEEIVATIDRYFDIVTINKSGGSILQFLLHGITGNFHEADPRAMRILEMLFSIEDALIDTDALQSDFIVLAGKPRMA